MYVREENVLCIYVCVILCMLSVPLLYRHSKRGKTQSIFIYHREGIEQNRNLLVGGFECHPASLSLSLSLFFSMIVVRRLILLYQGEKIVQFLRHWHFFSEPLRVRSLLAYCRPHDDDSTNIVAVRRRTIARDHRQAIENMQLAISTSKSSRLRTMR